MELTEILHFKQLVINISVKLNNSTQEQVILNIQNFQKQTVHCGKSGFCFWKMLIANNPVYTDIHRSAT